DTSQAANRSEETGGVKALSAPTDQGGVRCTCHRQDSPQRCGYQVARLPMRAWSLAAERSKGNLHKARVECMEVWKVESDLSEPSRRLSFNQEIGTRRQISELLLSCWHLKVQCQSLLATIVPPVEETPMLSCRSVHRFS